MTARKDPPTIYDLCIRITSQFEGTDFTTIANNFDGNGLSAGILQWNVGQSTLQNYILHHCNLMFYEFPVPIIPLVDLSPSDAIIWLKDNCYDIHGKFKPEWAQAWKKFLSRPEIINLQKKACDKYFQRAKEIAGSLGLSHQNKRAMCWAFDLATQSWSLGIDTPQPSLERANAILQMYSVENFMIWSASELQTDQIILVIASHMRSLKCKPEWRQDFFTRKCTIAIGEGIVHGKKYNFRKLFTES